MSKRIWTNSSGKDLTRHEINDEYLKNIYGFLKRVKDIRSFFYGKAIFNEMLNRGFIKHKYQVGQKFTRDDGEVVEILRLDDYGYEVRIFMGDSVVDEITLDKWKKIVDKEVNLYV